MQVMLPLLSLLLANLISYTNSKLRFAFEIFRHGARSPYSDLTLENKDWFGEQWTGGTKELTSVGLRMHFLLGFRNQKKYIEKEKLISSIYDPREIYVVSTDTNRTILSATAQLQGFYYNETKVLLSSEQIKNAKPPNKITDETITALGDYALPNGINVFPIHLFFVKEHTFQIQEEKNCKGVIPYYQKNKQRPEMLSFIKELNIKYPKICQKINKGINCFDDLDLTDSVLDTIMQEKIDDRNKGPYFKEMGYEFNDLYNDGMKYFKLVFVGNGIDSDKTIGLMTMSPTMKSIINWMDTKIGYDLKGNLDYKGYDAPKFVMFSGHDDSVGSFQAFMKAVFGSPIDYIDLAGNAFLELHLKDGITTPTSNKDYIVKYYVNDNLKPLLQYNEGMAYDLFKQTMEKNWMSTSTIQTFCGFANNFLFFFYSDNTKLNVFIGLAIFFIVLCAILVGVIGFMCVKMKKMKNQFIEPVNAPKAEGCEPVRLV